MTKKRFLAVFLAVALSISFVGCSFLPFGKKKDPAPESMEEVKDPEYPVVVGEYEVLVKPERVVSLSASITEKIYDLGHEDILVGISDYTIYPESLTSLEWCGTALLPNIEIIEDTNADLVISDVPLSDDMIAELEDRDIPYVVVERAANLDQLWESYINLSRIIQGEIIGGESGEQFVDKTKSWFDSFVSATAAEDSLNIMYLRRLKFNLATGDTLEGEILKTMGFTNIADDYANWIYPEEQATTEEGRKSFTSLDIMLFDGEDVNIKMLEGSEFYKGLKVTLEDKFIIVNAAAIERQSLTMFKEFVAVAEGCFEGISVPAIGQADSGGNSEESTPDEQTDDTEDTIDS